MFLTNLRQVAAKEKSRRDWQHVGLVAGFLAGRHFVGTKDLHYGYWQEGVEPNFANLPSAQEEYSQCLMKHIPWSAKRILDVGSGAGSLAQKLISRGHAVDCVSPCQFLNKQARELLGDTAQLYDCRYEEFESPGLYDAIVFCESFQYVDLSTALSRAAWQLAAGSRLVICDFFRKDVAGHSPIRGGHRLKEFWEVLGRHPFRVVRDLDITAQVAPTFTVIDQAFHEVVQPVWGEARDTLFKTHPLWAKCVSWWFRDRIQKFESKYFGRTRTAQNFEAFKTYRLIVLERTSQ